MKLSQLYSNKSNFKRITFGEGLNVVIGKVTQAYDVNKDSHNLGKTTLVNILDFMMLKDLDNAHFLKKSELLFNTYVFYLEIKLNNGKYLTIRRCVSTSSKISFKLNDTSTTMNDDSHWDVENMGLTAAKTRLNDYLEFTVQEKWNYRKSISYFLRTQKDYIDVFQLGKYQNGKHIEWKPFIFSLLGFNGDLLTVKYTADAKLEAQKKLISSIKDEFAVNEDEMDKIKGAISLKQSELEDTQKQIDKFNFYNQERKLNKDLIEEVESEIASLNSKDYKLSYELSKARQSVANTFTFDFDELRSIYNEAKVLLPQALVHDYEALEKFNKEITEERNKYLRIRIKEIESQLHDVRGLLKVKNEQRSEILGVLFHEDSFKKFKQYQVQLANMQGEIFRLEEQLKNIDKIGLLQQSISTIQAEIDQAARNIKEELNSVNSDYNSIRKTFSQVFKAVFNVTALLYTKPNGQGNLEFFTSTQDNDIMTSEGDGTSYRKLLCVAFDVAVLLTYNNRSFYRFVYHDGVLEGLDNRKKRNFMELIRHYCNENDLQYIFTSIEDDLPQDILASFADTEVCLTLTDEGDEGRLFGMKF